MGLNALYLVEGSASLGRDVSIACLDCVYWCLYHTHMGIVAISARWPGQIGERERKMSVSDGQADVQEVEYIAWGYMGSVNDRE